MSYNGRDYLIVKIIGGATKAGVQVDRKKEANRTASRGNKMARADRGQKTQENGMMVAELKHLRSLVKAKDQRLATLEKEVEELRLKVNLTEMLDPTTEENQALAAEAKKEVA
jgi:hypothetical protein